MVASHRAQNDILSKDTCAFIKKSLTQSDKLKLMRGMLLTRALDNALKHLFLSGEILYEGKGFHGKGFRSLGQEAIYGASFFLKTGSPYCTQEGYVGDVAAPLIRDLGVFLAMSGDDCESVINAQAGKAGLPCDGRDLHYGDLSHGLITAAAPLAIATLNALGMAVAFKLRKEARVSLSFIGDGGSSLGEWHEAINFAAVKHLPMIFCIENNQIALSTGVTEQSRALCFADKGIGYGMPALSVDGNSVEDVAAVFKLAADHARNGKGPVLIEVLSMRMGGHAHHDDMLYLGYDPELGLEIKPAKKSGYVDQKRYEHFRGHDPIALYATQLLQEKILDDDQKERLWLEVKSQVESAIDAVKARAWPKVSASDEELVYSSPYIFKAKSSVSPHYQFASDGKTYLQAIADATAASFKKHPSCYVLGEDVAPPYGNAFMVFKSIMGDFPDRLLNTPISENAIVGACVGMAMAGMRPVGEMQFNDFAACAMNQIVNNAAKSFYRSKIPVPMVLRMPYGGLRRAGPYHSQDTAPWFYRVAGLKIIAPSTPHDCYHLLMQAVDDPDPVLFYEHIALYRDPKLKQHIGQKCDPLGASLVRSGDALTIISYGAYVHRASAVAEELLQRHGSSIELIDLRYLKPVDIATCVASVKKTGRVMFVGEDSVMGSILQAIAAEISEYCFHYLDAPVRVLGSRNTPVPYGPSLEDDYLLSKERIAYEALQLMVY